MARRSGPEYIERRGQLLAELFLNDLGAKVTQSPFDSVDYLALFETDDRGYQIMAVELKATERPLPSKFPVSTKWLNRVAHSNIPTLLLVADVKQNKLGFAWLNEVARELRTKKNQVNILVPLEDASHAKHSIFEHLQPSVVATA